MLQTQTQENILLLIAGDLGKISKFRQEGITLTNDLFNEANQHKLAGLEKARKYGYTELTHKFIEEYQLDMPMNKVPHNDFLDLTLEIKKQITEQNKKKTKDQLNKAFKQYESSSDENELEAIKQIQLATATISTVYVKNTTKTLSEIVEEEMNFEEGKELIPSYLDELDNDILLGGFERSGIHVISGFPGNGKTTTAVQFATLQAINGYKVLFLSLEQKAIKITSNVLSVASENSVHNRSFFNVSKLTKETAVKTKTEAMKVISERIQDNFHIDDTRWETQNEFIERVRKACLVEEYDICVIDNFQNAPRPKDVFQVEQTYTQLADELLTIALASKTAILALSQLTLSHGQEKTKYSSRLNEHAITNIKIELVEPKEDDVDDVTKIQMTTLKARSGKQGVASTFNFNGAKSIIGSFSMPQINKDKQDQHNINTSLKKDRLPF